MSTGFRLVLLTTLVFGVIWIFGAWRCAIGLREISLPRQVASAMHAKRVVFALAPLLALVLLAEGIAATIRDFRRTEA